MYPAVPAGLLEAVAFTTTRFHHLTYNNTSAEGCTGIPRAYGLMGLVSDGKGYFHNNLEVVARISGYSKEDIQRSPEHCLLAWAKAYTAYSGMEAGKGSITETAIILSELSELPLRTEGQIFAFNTQLYSIFSFMTDPRNQQYYGFADPHYDLKGYFGENYSVLSSSSVVLDGGQVKDKKGKAYSFAWKDVALQSPDYSPALWTAASSCNYSVGRNASISAVTVHDVEGTYAGCISWFQNCAAKVSAHYVIRSSDGQVTQMVLESNMAWHVGSENPYTIGIEHEGYASQTGWYTNAMYTSSADLVRDITTSGYGINPLRCYYGASCSGLCPLGACTTIKGHQHYPNQSHVDPGPNWDWIKYYELINNNPITFNYTAATGNLYDSGGPTGNYTNDERYLYRIQPAGASTVTLTFSSFSLEANWDFLYIYDGGSLSSPLIGKYTGTNSPGTVTSAGNTILLQFRSDCNTPDAGWAMSWTGNGTTGAESAEGGAELHVFPNPASEKITIDYLLPANSKMSIALTDMLGRQTLLLPTAERTAGAHRTEFNTTHFAKGVYSIELRSGSGTSVKKLVIQ